MSEIEEIIELCFKITADLEKYRPKRTLGAQPVHRTGSQSAQVWNEAEGSFNRETLDGLREADRLLDYFRERD